MHSEFDWLVTWEQGYQIWLCMVDAQQAEGNVMSLAVWPIPRSSLWEWEVLAISDDQHVYGGAAASLDEAREAAEAALLIISEEASKGACSNCMPQHDHYPDDDALINASPPSPCHCRASL